MDRLLELQAIDLSIDRMDARLAVLESGAEVAAAGARVGAIEARMGELQLSIDEVATAQRRLEGDVDSMQRKIDAERRRLYDGTVANAKELQSIQAEVENLTARKSRKEDQLLELMEQREELDGHLAPVEAELTEARDRLTEIEDVTGRELVELERALGERGAERAALVPAFGEELLMLYEDLRRQKKGVGAASLVDGVCQGCHQKLSPVYVDRLKRSNGIWRCEYCRRILVLG